MSGSMHSLDVSEPMQPMLWVDRGRGVQVGPHLEVQMRRLVREVAGASREAEAMTDPHRISDADKLHAQVRVDGREPGRGPEVDPLAVAAPALLLAVPHHAAVVRGEDRRPDRAQEVDAAVELRHPARGVPRPAEATYVG